MIGEVNMSAVDPLASVDASAAPAPGGLSTEGVRPRVPFYAWYGLGLLTFVNVFGYMDRVALGVLLQSIKHDLHLSDTQLGLVSGLAFAIFYCTFGVPLARYADRSSRVRLISSCLAIWSLMTALTGMARNFPQLFAARTGVGIGEAGCVPPAHSLISDYFPRERRTLAVSIFQAGSGIGVSAGLIVVGLLGQLYGWRLALQIIGAAGLPLAVLMWLTMKEPERRGAISTTREPFMKAVVAIFRRPAFAHLAAAWGLMSLASSSFFQWVPTFLMRSFDLSMMQAGASLGFVTALTGVIGPVSGGVAATWLAGRDKRWELWLPGWMTLIGTPIFVLAVMSPSAWIVLLLKIPYNFITGIGSASALGAIHSFVEPQRRALAISLVMFLSTMVGMGVGPFIIGTLSDWLEPSFGKESLRYALALNSLLVPWSALHFFLAARTSERDRVD